MPDSNSKDTVVNSTPPTMPTFKYAKLHTAIRIPGVTQQTTLTLDSKEFSKNFSLEVVGNFLKVTASKAHTLEGTTYTPLTNVVCLSES